MKKILLILTVLFSTFTFAQTNGITYQAVIYNANGESVPGIKNSNTPLSNQEICLQFSILNDLTLTEYQEKISVTTDAYGMVNLVIGNGIQTGGFANSFGAIVWNSTNKFLKIGLNQTGSCDSFEEISYQLLNYVPFAFAATSATSVSGVVGLANGGTNATTVIGAKTNLQLHNVDNTRDLDKPISTLTQLALDAKVDKVAGKNFSTEDFSTAEKTKLASISGTNTGDQDLSSFATTTDLVSKVDKVTGKELSTNDFTTVEKTKLAAISGTNTGDQDLSSFATTTDLASKVDKVTGKELSTNDFTTAEKTKLASISGTNTGDQDLSLFATLLSPSLSGIPTAPTASSNTNTTQIATTAFVNNTVANKFVDLITNQTIAGTKTFNSDIIANGLIIGKGKGQNNYNTVFGAGALNSSNANGTRNTAIGYLALTQYAGTTFDNNTGVGYFNMIGLTTGYGNTSIGAETMFNVGTASNNTGIGNQSLINVAGDNNVGVGARSGDGLTTGTNNTFIGTQARTTSAGETISNATALGYGAVVTENNTIQLGNSSITHVKTSGSVLASGFKTPTGTSSQYLMADGSVSSGSSSSSSGVPYTGATGSVDLGTYDLKVNGLTVGIGAGAQPSNVVLGKSAMENNTTGGYSVAVGHEALKSTTNGNSNTAVGFQALRSNTTGGANIAIGMNAMPNNTIGQQNIAIGQSTLYSNTEASGNTVIGNSAATSITTGGSNTIIGHETAGGLTTGSWNTIIGRNIYTGNISNNIVISNGQGAIKAQHDGNGWKFTGRMVMSTATIDYSELNNYDVSNISILFVKPNSTWTNIYGLTGGVLGQVIDIYSVNNQTSNCCSGLSLWNFDSSSNSGTQKFVAPGGINIDSNKNTTLVFDGTYWRVSKLGGM